MFGAQIDLIIDRDDHIINICEICEIKYADKPYIIDKATHENLNKKLISFQYFTKTKKLLFATIITSSGLIPNKHSNDLIRNSIEVSQFCE